jgi:hypothetical protein
MVPEHAAPAVLSADATAIAVAQRAPVRAADQQDDCACVSKCSSTMTIFPLASRATTM